MGKILLAMADIDCLLDENNYNKAYNNISLYRKEKADRLKSFKDRCRCVASGVLLNQVLRDWEKLSETEKPEIVTYDLCQCISEYDSEYDYEIATVSNGKPVFSTHRDIYFNISHAGKYVVCVVADCPVGVDIEGDRPVRENVAKRFFSEKEYGWINECEEDKEGRFFSLWTLKEAYGKLTGEGIALSISKTHFDMGKEAVLVDESGRVKNDVTFFQYRTEDNYFIALAKGRIVG
ncbi:MAG: 4'-phosphopantetheinyl transferase superfamily protein [Lachnospira sp.]|nr:4'-phosphopantetheinyl transferase superfamily protein [Lachnospira sp.]